MKFSSSENEVRSAVGKAPWCVLFCPSCIPALLPNVNDITRHNGLSLFHVGSVKKNGMFAVSVLMQGSIFMTTNSCQYMATISIENYYMTEQQRSNEVVTSKRTNVV